MTYEYFVRNASTYEYLNTDKGWCRARNSYGVASFASEEEAKAFFPKGKKAKGIEFMIVRVKVRDEEEAVTP